MEKEFREGFAWGLLAALVVMYLFGRSLLRKQRDRVAELPPIPGGKARLPVPGDTPVSPSLSAAPTSV